MRQINEIILHCSASDMKAQDDIKHIRELHTSPKDKEFKWGKYNTHGNGWKREGYHYYIRKDGTIQKGLGWDAIGSHCRGHNTNSIGICLGGDTKFTYRQFKALEHLLERLTEEFGNLPVSGHYKYSSKSCPNFDVDEFILGMLWEK